MTGEGDGTMDDDEASGRDGSHLAFWRACGCLAQAFAAALALAVTMATSSAQDPAPHGMDLATAASRRFPQPISAGSLIGRTVLQPVESKTVLGRVEQVVRAQDGQVQLVVAYGGWLGVGARPIAVPADAMALLGRDLEILDFTPKQLDGFPAYDASASDLVPSSVTIHIGLARPSH